jgi:hypothetical protein
VSFGELVLAALVALLCVASIAIIVIGGREPRHRLGVFDQTSGDGADFESSSRRLRRIGAVGLALAVLAAILAAILALHLAYR